MEGLHSKNLFKVEKYILIFKTPLMVSIFVLLYGLALGIFRKSFRWNEALGNIAGLIIPVIDFETAVFVKKVLLKRDVFQQVSSYSKK